jgi:hypothetical protein
MSKQPVSHEEPRGSRRKSSAAKRPEGSGRKADPLRPLVHLQQQVGNRAIQRLLAQRSESGPSEVDDETAERINQKRGGGQPLDSAVQQQMSSSTGEDYSQVKVHADPEANDLSQQLGAKAFTTGQDVFFREGAYQPHTAGGQELLAHELTHVSQQRRGQVSSGSGMQVNAPGDAFEQQADEVAHSVTSGQAAAAAPSQAGVQREAAPEEEEAVQMQEEEEETVQAQEEEEEAVQMQEEEEEEVQMQAAEEEEVQAQAEDEEQAAV